MLFQPWDESIAIEVKPVAESIPITQESIRPLSTFWHLVNNAYSIEGAV